MPSWDEFERDEVTTQKPHPLRERLDALCSQVFNSGAGAELMKLLRAMTIDHRSQARAHEAQLREDEAVRRFVATLDQARERGLKPRAEKAKTD
jgi:hypothetical protein